MPKKNNTPEEMEAFRLYMREYHKKRYQTDPEYKAKQKERVKARQKKTYVSKKLLKQQEKEKAKEEANKTENEIIEIPQIVEPPNNETI